MTISTTYLDGKAVMSIRGRFDFNLHGAFRKSSEEILAMPAVKSIAVNLREVDYLDSSALGMLLLFRDKALQSGSRSVSLSNCRGMVLQVLEVANFSRLFKLD